MRDFIKKSLLPLKIKMQLDRVIRAVLAGVTLAGAVSLVMSLLSLFTVVPFLRVRMLAVIAYGFILSLLVGILWRHPWKSVLVEADATGLQERVITAWTLEGVVSPAAELQREDTRRVLASSRPQSAYKIRIGKIFYIPGLALLLLAFALSLLHGRVYEETRTREALITEMRDQEKNIEEKIREEAEKKELSGNQLKEMRQALEKLKEGFRKAKTEEDALKALAQMENEMKKLESQDPAGDLRALENALEQSELTGSIADALKSEDPNALEEALKELEKSLGNDDNREELKETLKEALKNINPDSATAEALQNLVNQASSGAMGASAASRSLSEILEGAKADAQNMDDGGQAAGEVAQTARNARVAVSAVDNTVARSGQSGAASDGSQSGQGDADQNGQGSQGQNGQGGKGNQPGNSGSGGSNTHGQGASGAGQGASGAGQGSTSEDAGYAEGDQPGSGRAPGSGKEEDFRRIYVPEHLGGDGNDSTLAGQKLDSGSSTFNETDGAPVLKGSMVPWQDVLAEYRDDAVQSMEHQEIPAGMKDLVRDYFSSLN